MAWDAAVAGRSETSAARAKALELEERLSACEARERCLLDILLQERELRAAPVRSGIAQNTVTAALADGGGSCAALVGAILALTDPFGRPFEAVVLRDHVLLGSTGDRRVFYEVLRNGEEIDERALARYEPHAPTGPVRLSGEKFVAYYLDNLAARLAESREQERAAAAFSLALARAPGSARIHYNYGTFLLGRADPARAAKHLTRAIRLGWRDADAFVNRGSAFWELGRLTKARRDFKEALRLDLADRRARANLRRLDREAGTGTRP